MDEDGDDTNAADTRIGNLEHALDSDAQDAADAVVIRADAPHVAVLNAVSECSSAAFDVESLPPGSNDAIVEEPDEVVDTSAVPDTVGTLHAALVRQHNREVAGLKIPVHDTYALSGVMIPYAVPPYLKPTHPGTMLDRMEGQNNENEFKDTHVLNDHNCKLDFAEWVLRCQISHREYRHLWELIKKWLPVGTAFPDRDNGLPCGKKHPGAHLLRLVRTRKSLEEYLDKRVAGYSQACHIPPVNVNSAHV